MPIRLDYALARKRFAAAFELARSEKALPREWLEHAQEIGRSPAKTFIPMLGTALLAKATNPQVDPFSLKTRKLQTAYSARNLCQNVLVPCAVGARVSIGTTGREPLNNQPFFRHERVSRDMIVASSSRPFLERLCTALESAAHLDSAASLDALAAFLRVRLAAAPAALPPLDQDVPALQFVLDTISTFVEENPEGGKRGQALLAASLDLVFDSVRTTRVNDPSRHYPGDAFVIESGTATLAGESKQRPGSLTEIVQFASRCQQHGIHRAVVALLDPRQPALASENDLTRLAVEGILVQVVYGAKELVRSALTWSKRALGTNLAELTARLAERLVELEVSEAGQRRFRELLRS